jgi:ComF family protein
MFPTARDLPPSRLRCLADGLLNLLYPESCVVCASPVSRLQDCGVCQRCWNSVLALRISRPWCPSCGVPFQSTAIESGFLCGECIARMPVYAGARSYGYYRGELSRLIQGLKFENRRNLVGLLAPLIAGTFVNSWTREEIDLVVPVPLHPRRKRERGFNQAALLARGLARLTGIPMVETALVRARNTPPQVGLTDAERRHNVRQAFHCSSPGLVAHKRLLLVDDVMTTGATVCSASQALLDAGAGKVSVLTVARAVPGME